tara:strand:- start:126 stop:1841 length:1716 start_codon:yes stop_codon:yes gene_type:complete
MKETARDFLSRLDVEEAHFSDQVALDKYGLGMLTAIKEFDYYYYNFIRNERTEDTDLHMHLMQLGLPKLIAGILSSIPSFQYPEVTFKSDRKMIVGALSLVSAYGFIEQGRRLAHASFAGECEIHQSNESAFDVVMPKAIYNMEQHEAEVEHHYTRISRENSNAMIQAVFEKQMERINKLLLENVFVFNRYYMGYNAHPDLDDFFFALASSEIQHQSGWDTFHWKLNFGGIPILKYNLAVTYFLSLAIKHEKFAESLITKAPEVRLRDILTITTPRQQFEDDLIEALNIYGPSYEGYTPLTREEAKTILKVLSVRRENLEILNSTMPPLPFLVEFSDVAWVTSVSTVQTGGISFLLNSLKFHFPKDYDRNQQTREGAMQKALRRLLEESLPGLTLVDNVVIRRNGRRVTDIDFATIDEVEGTVILFQLKHQDAYGGDIRRRSNRSARLKTEVQHWLKATRSWIKEEPIELRRALRLRKNAKCNQVYLVIVAKHFAHFLSTVDLKEDAAYATWVQFYDALTRLESEGKPRTLHRLAELLQQYMSHKMAKSFSLDLEDDYHLPGLTYRIRPET